MYKTITTTFWLAFSLPFLLWFGGDCMAQDIDSTTPIQGIDVSHYQGTVHWSKVAADKLPFAIAKATGGETYTDPNFHNNWHGMRENGIIRGAYHFFYAGDDPVDQALNYLKTVGSFKKTDMPPLLDVEITDGVAADELLKRVLVWLAEVEKRTGRIPIVYSDVYFGQTYLTSPELAKYPLWIADYSADVQGVPSPWQQKGWSLWQYSQSGKVDGIEGDVDMDQFNGTLAEFKAFIATTVVTNNLCEGKNND
ncbi:MAG: lysozyme [Phenylobacterium sp.]|jgi:lysozyme